MQSLWCQQIFMTFLASFSWVMSFWSFGERIICFGAPKGVGIVTDELGLFKGKIRTWVGFKVVAMRWVPVEDHLK